MATLQVNRLPAHDGGLCAQKSDVVMFYLQLPSGRLRDRSARRLRCRGRGTSRKVLPDWRDTAARTAHVRRQDNRCRPDAHGCRHPAASHVSVCNAPLSSTLRAREPKIESRYRRETQLMALSKHPNVLRVRGEWIEGSKLCIAVRYMSHGQYPALIARRAPALLKYSDSPDPQALCLTYRGTRSRTASPRT